MTASITLYFQLHQPYRLRHFRFSEIGKSVDYFDDAANRDIFLRVAERCYRPAGILLERLLKEFGSRLAVSFSFSGTWLDQCEAYDLELYQMYQRIARLPNVEVLSETAAHSLVSVADSDEFLLEIIEHRDRITQFCGRSPQVFRNTELTYSNEIGATVAAAGFLACLVEGWEHLLESNFDTARLFRHPIHSNLKLLPRCYRRSDDIAFRFSNRNWSEWPLTPEKYVDWLERTAREGAEFIGLFMDYETLGEHQSKETGIWEFMEGWLRRAASSSWLKFSLPSEVVKELPARDVYDVGSVLTWADTERDLSAWLGNDWQKQAMGAALGLAEVVRQISDPEVTQTWRRLLTSDHFYYMSTKCAADGEVHGYFSPFADPQEAYLEYRNALAAFDYAMREKRK